MSITAPVKHARNARNEQGRQHKGGTSGQHGNSIVLRYIAFFVGLVINSFGVVLITEASLGTSPISSLPYVLSLRFTALSFGMTTFIVNAVFILIQALLLRRDFEPILLLQFVADFLFSAFIDMSEMLLSWYSPTTLGAQIAGVVLGSAILAVGVSIEVAPNVVVVPGEGTVRVIARVSGVRFGTVKNCFDLSLVAIALVLSFAFFGDIEGLGAGTVISALLVGQIVNLANAHLPIVEKIRQLASEPTLADTPDLADVPELANEGTATVLADAAGFVEPAADMAESRLVSDGTGFAENPNLCGERIDHR